MLTIPTTELLGLITDVIGFAPDEKTDPHHGILLSWDGAALYASATDVLSAGVASWIPGTGAEQYAHTGDASTKATDELDPNWGDAADDRWAVFVPHADAKTIVKVYKLAAKFALTPLTVETNITGTRLIVARAKQEWCSGNTMTIDTPATTTAATFPDVLKIAGAVFRDASNGQYDGVMRFSPQRLAAFGAVRGWTGEFVWTGENTPTIVSIGNGFTGFVFPVSATTTQAADALKHAAGLGQLDVGAIQSAVDQGLLDVVDEDGDREPLPF